MARNNKKTKDVDKTNKHITVSSKPLRPKGVEHTGLLFVAPFVIVFLIFSVYPVLKTLYLSFCEYKGGLLVQPKFIGLANYDRVIHDKMFWQSLWNTAKIWGVNIVLQLGLAFLLTIIFSDVKYKIRGLAVYRAIYYLPNLIAATSIAFLFKTLLDQNYGTFNQILNKIGFYSTFKIPHIDWIGNSKTAFATIGVIQAWMWFGNSFIMLMAGVMGISKDYFEAAAIDGAGRWKIFTKITLPLLKPIMLYVGVTSLIGGLQMFDLPQLMVARASASFGSIRTVVMYLYQFGFSTTKEVGYAAAVAYVLFLIILIFSIIQFVIMGRREKD